MKDEGHAEAAPYDRLLLAAVVGRDERALRLLYDRHAGLLLTVAHGATGNWGIAEEVVQDVFVQCWYRAGSYEPSRGSVVGWLVGMTRNKAIDQLRRTNAAKRPDASSVPIERVAPGAVSARPAVDSRLDVLAVNEALAELSEGERTTIILAIRGGMTQVEIAAALETPLGTVKSWMRRGLERLRARLLELGVEP
ncbi:MAG: sigma-70 family RNA polymerase sigma factor [Dehalococcoidia bacterium]|nr:sigma-70 family RNA polymerase sigma factor [Dehalococcoidia bacterium]